MQLPTHLITAVAIDKWIRHSPLPAGLKPVVTAAACFISHGILDKIARSTYHPPDPLDDDFWRIYHQKILPNLTWMVVGTFAPKHFLAMFFSAMPDLDWVARGIAHRRGRPIPGWETPVMNEGLHHFLDRIPVINQLNRLPDLRFQRKGVLVELGLVAFMLAAIHLLDRK